jgi:hypothetical protein
MQKIPNMGEVEEPAWPENQEEQEARRRQEWTYVRAEAIYILGIIFF